MSKLLRLLLRQLHSEDVVNKLADSPLMRQSAQVAHSAVQTAKERAERVAKQLSEQGVNAKNAADVADRSVVQPLSSRLSRLHSGGSRLWSDAKADWRDLEAKLSGTTSSTRHHQQQQQQQQQQGQRHTRDGNHQQT